jgi:predicted nucleotidyltransferase
MKSCGVVVEYNPFHNGHQYHVQEAKKVSQAELMVAVMSGNFLQRGEPAIIDKFHRARAALTSGVDIVLELPYAFAVQHSDYFAKGAIQALYQIGAASICFGSESGDPEQFKTGYHQLTEAQDLFDQVQKEKLKEGLSFPDASMLAYRTIGLTNEAFDLSKPNNILGFGYVKAILEKNLPMDIHTIKRMSNQFHEPTISSPIASATSIRKEITEHRTITEKVKKTMPEIMIKELLNYKEMSSIWHYWEDYFQLVHYRVQTMSNEELRDIHGIVEGLENRLKQTARQAENMVDWMQSVKSKRYTWTRIQRIFTHLLTNTTKHEIQPFLKQEKLPYLRILGMTKRGQSYLNQHKKKIETPIIHSFSRDIHPMLELEEKATAAYYSILPPSARKRLTQQELKGPIIM